MTRLLKQTLHAARGMDANVAATVLPPDLAQQVTNLKTNSLGRLSGDVRLAQLKMLIRSAQKIVNGVTLPSADLNVDGLCWCYRALILNADAPPTEFDALVVICEGHVYLYELVNGEDPPLLYPPILADARATIEFTAAFHVGKRVRFAYFGDEIVMVQEGGARVSNARFNGLYLYACGISDPSDSPTLVSAATAGVKTGTFIYKYTYFDAKGRESNLSGGLSVTVTSKQVQVSVPLSFTANDFQIKGVNFYVNTNGGDVWYRIATKTRADVVSDIVTCTDNDTDAAAAAGAVGPLAGQNSPSNLASIVCTHKNRVFMNDLSNPNKLQVSNQGSPTQFNLLLDLELPDLGGRLEASSDQGDPITGLASLGSLLAVFKRRGTWFLFGDDAAEFTLRPVYERGCLSPDTVQRCGNLVLFLSEDGVYSIGYGDGGGLQKVSGPIQPYIDALRRTPQGWKLLKNAFALYADNRYLLVIDTMIWVFDFNQSPPTWSSLTFGLPPFGFQPTTLVDLENGGSDGLGNSGGSGGSSGGDSSGGSDPALGNIQLGQLMSGTVT